MPNPTNKYVVASKNCKNPEAAFKIVNYLIANEQQWVEDGISSTEMGTSDFYPLNVKALLLIITLSIAAASPLSASLR